MPPAIFWPWSSKSRTTPQAGLYSYVRVYSGTLKSGSQLLNIGKKKRERVNRLLRMHANRTEAVDSLAAGDIGVIVGLKESQTGDTLGLDNYPVLLEKMQFPQPVISVAIEPQSTEEAGKLAGVLQTLMLEDPTFLVKEDKETGQTLISGMGELHLDVLVTKITKEYKVKARIGNPQVSYRETVTVPVTHTEIFDRTLAGKGKLRRDYSRGGSQANAAPGMFSGAGFPRGSFPKRSKTPLSAASAARSQAGCCWDTP